MHFRLSSRETAKSARTLNFCFLLVEIFRIRNESVAFRLVVFRLVFFIRSNNHETHYLVCEHKYKMCYFVVFNRKNPSCLAAVVRVGCITKCALPEKKTTHNCLKIPMHRFGWSGKKTEDEPYEHKELKKVHMSVCMPVRVSVFARKREWRIAYKVKEKIVCTHMYTMWAFLVN